jgi:DnaJ-class molecular chaperone
MKRDRLTPETRKVCPECGGSGMRAGCSGDLECFDCGGEGSWEVDDEQLAAEEAEPVRRAA